MASIIKYINNTTILGIKVIDALIMVCAIIIIAGYYVFIDPLIESADEKYYEKHGRHFVNPVHSIDIGIIAIAIITMIVCINLYLRK